MLPRFFRIRVFNNSGQTVTFNNNGRFNLKAWGWIVNPTTGKITYTQISDDDLSFIAASFVAAGDEETSDEIDNTTTLFLGLLIQLEVTHDEGAAADGTFNLHLDSGDASGELQSDASGFTNSEVNKIQSIGPLIWDGSRGDDEVVRSDTIHI